MVTQGKIFYSCFESIPYLITPSHDFLKELETKEKKISKMKELVTNLPEERAKVLNRLMYHLKL